MVYLSRVQNQNINRYNTQSFGKKDDKKSQCESHDALMYEDKKKRPITTALKINGSKLVNAFTKYPKKGFLGSKNANFYEFLTMGTVPYLAGSATMIAVFNLAAKHFNTPDAMAALKHGKKMGIGVALYGIGKTLSKKLIETPVNMKYGIDVNLPYKKVINELPEKGINDGKLVTHEYHKAFESVDFPRWDLMYGNEAFGPDRNSYYAKVGKKMGIKDDDLEHADQKVKPLIKEKLVKTKLFSTLSSYLWAATGVGIAMQKPWEKLVLNPKTRIATAKARKEAGLKTKKFVVEVGEKFVASCKEFFNHPQKPIRIAGRALLGAAVGMTVLGNLLTLTDFNKDKGSKATASSPLIDASKDKVVC